MKDARHTRKVAQRTAENFILLIVVEEMDLLKIRKRTLHQAQHADVHVVRCIHGFNFSGPSGEAPALGFGFNVAGFQCYLS